MSINSADLQRAYEQKHNRALYKLFQQYHAKGQLYEALEWISEQKVRKRQEVQVKRTNRGIWVDAVNALYKDDLGILRKEVTKIKSGMLLERVGEVIEAKSDRLVLSWKTDCPVQQYGMGLPMEHVCRGMYHNSAEIILRKVDDGLWFDRNYGELRPGGPACVEIIRKGPMIVKLCNPDCLEQLGFCMDMDDVWKNSVKRRGGLPPYSVRLSPGPAPFASVAECEKTYPVCNTDWDEDDPILIDRKTRVPTSVSSFMVREQKIGGRIWWVLWAENVDKWLAVRYWNSATTGSIAEVRPPADIAGTPLAKNVLKAYGLSERGISTEDAVGVHPLKLEYMRKFSVLGQCVRKS